MINTTRFLGYDKDEYGDLIIFSGSRCLVELSSTRPSINSDTTAVNCFGDLLTVYFCSLEIEQREHLFV